MGWQREILTQISGFAEYGLKQLRAGDTAEVERSRREILHCLDTWTQCEQMSESTTTKAARERYVEIKAI